MDACGNRFAITRSRPQAYYYYAPEKGERTRNPKAYLPPRCVNHVPGLFCKRSPRLRPTHVTSLLSGLPGSNVKSQIAFC